MDFSDYKPTLDKLMQQVEETAKIAIKLSTQLEEVSRRLDRSEKSLEILLNDVKTGETAVHKAELCPFSRKLEEYDRLLFGGPDAEGIVGKMGRAERTLSWYKGALYITGTLVVVMLPIVTTLLIAFLKHIG
jgi:hypothetical protein